MTMTTTGITTIEPLTHQEAMRRQAHELRRTLAPGLSWPCACLCCSFTASAEGASLDG